MLKLSQNKCSIRAYKSIKENLHGKRCEEGILALNLRLAIDANQLNLFLHESYLKYKMLILTF